jgi:hypothetical protein
MRASLPLFRDRDRNVRAGLVERVHEKLGTTPDSRNRGASDEGTREALSLFPLPQRSRAIVRFLISLWITIRDCIFYHKF